MSYFYPGETEELASLAGASGQALLCWVCPGLGRRLWGLTSGGPVLLASGRRGNRRSRKKRNVELAINQLPAAILSVLFMHVGWYILILTVPLKKRRCIFLLRSEYALNIWYPPHGVI